MIIFKKNFCLPIYIKEGEIVMATIIENLNGRRLIRVSTDDIISIVREYQSINCDTNSYEKTRQVLDKKDIYLPEDV